MKKIKISILGLGYIGLPLAIKLAQFYETTGFDININRINELKKNIDRTKEVTKKDFKKKLKIDFTSDINEIKESNFYIITVPSPIKKNKTPDFQPLIKACDILSKVIKRGDICVFESTVYPGATEEVLIPRLEKKSDYKLNEDFFVGYSPERANPGDKIRKLENITKVISGSNPNTIKTIYKVYSKIIKAGIHIVSSIKVAEACKIIENVQRDLNIALINELTKIFDKLQINTFEVLDAAATKWNFNKYEPGLVGGHCIGVDPNYLTYKSKKLKINPRIILSGRETNEDMFKFVAKKFLNQINKKKIKILILGYTFKENCPDIRNTQIHYLLNFLKKKGANVDINDPWVLRDELSSNLKKSFTKKYKNNYYDGIIIAVKHKVFVKLGINKIKDLGKKNAIIFDLKNLFPKEKKFLRL